jgi:putative tricarboxylic transport membrane protein
LRRGWQIACLCFAALFAFAIWKASAMRLQDTLGPGPGFFPLWLGIIGGVLAIVLLVEVSRQPYAGPSLADLVPEKSASLRILMVLALLGAAALAFEPLGFRLTAAGFTGLLLLALGARSLLIGVPFVLAASLGVFHVFYHWLKVPLPIGVLGI